MRVANLQTTLYANTAFSISSALLILLFSDWIAAQVIDLPNIAFKIVGIGLLVFAADVFYIARKLPTSRQLAMLIFWADIAWVVATPVVPTGI